MKYLVVFWWVVFCCSVWADADGFRIFTDRQGRSVEARVVSFNDTRNLVELELKNKKRKKVKPSIFSQSDQEYILEWKALRDFGRDSMFNVDLKKEVLKKWSEKSSVVKDFREVAFEIKLINKGAGSLKNLEVTYNLYAEQEYLERGGEKVKEICKSGRIAIEKLNPRERRPVMTERVEIYDQKLAGGYSGYVGGLPEYQNGEVRGIWVRISMTTDSGAIVTRDFVSPSNIKTLKQWQEPER